MVLDPITIDEIALLRMMIDYYRKPGNQSGIPFHDMPGIFELNTRTVQVNVGKLKGLNFVIMGPGPKGATVTILPEGFNYFTAASGQPQSSHTSITATNSNVLVSRDVYGDQTVTNTTTYNDLVPALESIVKDLSAFELTQEQESDFRSEVKAILDDIRTNTAKPEGIKSRLNTLVSIISTSSNVATILGFALAIAPHIH